MMAHPLTALRCVPVMVSLALGCSSSPEPTEPSTTTSPALPGPQPGTDVAPLPHASLTPSPACGGPGSHVLLRLEWTSDKRVPECVRADDFEVVFGSKRAKITMVGPTFDGHCALDVLVPPAAEGGVVTVTMGRDVFESKNAFGVPCP